MCRTYFFFRKTPRTSFRFALRQSSINPFSFFYTCSRKTCDRPGHLFSKPVSLIWPLGIDEQDRWTDGRTERWKERQTNTDRHSPYGWGAAPYLGSAKRGAGLPFPVASFLCVLEPAIERQFVDETIIIYDGYIAFHTVQPLRRDEINDVTSHLYIILRS